MINTPQLLSLVFGLGFTFGPQVSLEQSNYDSLTLQIQNQSRVQVDPGSDFTIDDEDEEETGEP